MTDWKKVRFLYFGAPELDACKPKSGGKHHVSILGVVYVGGIKGQFASVKIREPKDGNITEHKKIPLATNKGVGTFKIPYKIDHKS